MVPRPDGARIEGVLEAINGSWGYCILQRVIISAQICSWDNVSGKRHVELMMVHLVKQSGLCKKPAIVKGIPSQFVDKCCD